MARTAFESVDQYIAAQPAPVQPALRRLRGIIRKAVPRAEEVISYQIPAYKLPGATVIYFAGWKQHVSLYPASPELVAERTQALAPRPGQRRRGDRRCRGLAHAAVQAG